MHVVMHILCPFMKYTDSSVRPSVTVGHRAEAGLDLRLIGACYQRCTAM